MDAKRVTDAFADERIRSKIAEFPPKPRDGLNRVNQALRSQGVDASARLHLVSAVVDLGRVADATRPMRLARHARLPRHSESDFPWGSDFKD